MRPEANLKFRIAVGSFIEEYNNKLREEQGDFLHIGTFDHPYPSTKILWIPDPFSNLQPSYIKAMSVDVIGILPNAVDASDIFEYYLTPKDQEQQIILQTAADALMNICLAFMAFIIIFLIVELLSPSSQLRSSYFGLITFGMLQYSTFIISKDIAYIFSESDIKSFINNFIQWYMSFDLACWNSFLALNRATALAFPVKHDRLWTRNCTVFYCFIIFVFPFVADFKSFFYPCFWKGYSINCTSFQLNDQIYASAWTMSHAIFALVVTVISLTYSKSKGFDAAHKVECRLMFQTVFGSTMIILFAVSQWLSTHFLNTRNRVLFIQFLGISQFLSAFYFYPIIFVLFFASPIFRNNFLRFYRMDFIFGQRITRVSQNSFGNKITILS